MNADVRRSSQSYFQQWEHLDKQWPDNTFSFRRDSSVSPMTLPSRLRPSYQRAETMEKTVTSHPDSTPTAFQPPPGTAAKRLSEGRAFRMESISELGGSILSSRASRKSSVSKRSVRWSDCERASDATYTSTGQKRSVTRPALRSSQGDRSESSTSTQTAPVLNQPSGGSGSGSSQYSPKTATWRSNTPKSSRPEYTKYSSSKIVSPKPPTPLRGPQTRVTLPSRAISGAKVMLLSDFVEPDAALQQEGQAENTTTVESNVKKLRNRVPKFIRRILHSRDARHTSQGKANSSMAYRPRPTPKYSWRVKLRSGKASSSKPATISQTSYPNAVDHATAKLLEQVSAALEHLVVDQHDVQRKQVSTADNKHEPFFCGPRRVPSGLMDEPNEPPRPLDPAAAALEHTYTHLHTLGHRWATGPTRRFSAVPGPLRFMERRRGQMPQATPAADATYKTRIKVAALPSAWQTQEFMRIDITDPAGPSYLPSEMRRILTPRGSQEFLGNTDDYDEFQGRGGGQFRQQKRQGDSHRESRRESRQESNSSNGNYGEARDRGDEQNTMQGEYKVFGARWGERAQTKEDDNAEAARQTARTGKGETAANEFARDRRERREWERVPDHLPGSPLCPASPKWYYRDKTRLQELGRERRYCPEHGWRAL